MQRIVRFARLPTADQRLLASAAALLATTRVALSIVPFGVVQRWAALLERNKVSAVSDAAARRRVVWAVDAASRYIPASKNCLNRALTAKILFARQGLPTNLRIGVRRDQSGELLAHAWVEVPDGILIGNMPGLAQYVPLQPREGADR